MAHAGEGTPVELPGRLSPSRLGDFRQCPAKFYFGSIVKLPRPATEATTIGTLAHTAFENIFDHPRDERSIEAACAYVAPAWEELKVKPGYEHLVALGDSIVERAEHAVRSWFGVERPHNFDPVGRELRLVSEAAGVPLLGILDRVDRIETEDGERVYISDYKGLALDTPLPTPTGWTTMGDVAVGDEVLDPSGRATLVTAKSEIHHRPCYAVRFTDGTEIIADNVHLWAVADEGMWEVVSTTELAQIVAERGYARVPRRQPLEGRHSPGLDTAAAAGWIEGHDDGLADGEAHARAALRAERTQRAAVITMLSATDVSDGVLAVRVPDAARAEVLSELLATFSYPCEVDPDGDGFVVEFVCETPQWEVEAVEAVESVPTQCIQVASHTALYLAGRAMVVTHNTGKVPAVNDRFLDEKFFAMRVYALLWHTVHGEMPYELRLIYVAGGTRDSVRRVRVDEALLKRVRAELKGAYAEMKRSAQAGQFECKRQPLCQWCDYIDLCPQWHPELAGMAPGDLRSMHVDGQELLIDPK